MTAGNSIQPKLRAVMGSSLQERKPAISAFILVRGFANGMDYVPGTVGNQLRLRSLKPQATSH